MIQFNLLPDVKQEYIKAKRQKHSVIVISLLVAAASLFVFVMMFLTVYVFQRQHIKDLDSEIATSSATLKDTPDLDKVLTIQNQLKSLSQLHDAKPVTSRLFGYLSQVTPSAVTLGKINVDFTNATISVEGSADALSTVNKFVDTLKFSTYQEEGVASKDSDQPKPFKDVVLASFSRSDKETTYSINLNFDPAIFDSSKKITLAVPKIISTRSETEKPTELFKALPKQAEDN